MTSDETHHIVDTVAGLVEQHYVFPDVARRVAGLLRSGTYTTDTHRELADRVTHDLQSVNGDKHLRLMFHDEPLPDLADPAEAAAQHRRQAEEASYGVVPAAWSDGDVATLAFAPLLFDPQVSGDALSAAMRSVSEARGLVLDVRNCRGGVPSAVCLVLTYLLGPSIHLTDMVTRDPTDTQQLWTLPWVPGHSVADDVPVAVLTSARTFSGGEDLAYTLQAHGRAVVIGETTGGGAHPRDGFRVADRLEATVPVARSLNLVTGSNWEGTGVVPDLAVAAEDAPRVALERLTTPA